MFSYVFMKILEGRPGSYDRGMERISQGRNRRIKESVAARVPPGSQVLEIGCGTGELAMLLLERDCQVLGFDLSQGMLSVARQRIADGGLEDRFLVRKMGVDGMDELPAGRFDAVVSTLVFSELTDDERRYALEHAARVMKPAGTLVVADEVRPRTAAGRAAHSLARMPVLAATYLATGATTRPVADLSGEMAAAGFQIQTVERSHGDAFAMVVARTEGG